MRAKGTGGVQQVRSTGQWHAFLPSKKGEPKRFLGVFGSRYQAEKALDAWIAQNLKNKE